MKPLAHRTTVLAPSPTVAIDTRYKELKASGADIVSLGAGEPDSPTPIAAQNAAIEAIRDGRTKYSAPTGITELKTAIASKLRRENGLEYSESQIVVTSGAKHAIFSALLALVDPGDEVIIPSPYWVTYPDLVRYLGGTPIIVSCGIENGFRLSTGQLRQALSPRTKLVILNTPGNPTGSVYPLPELEALSEIIVEADIYCLSDEIYERLLYGDARHHSPASLGPAMQARSIVVNGVSKSFGMTGWRIGYAAAPRQLSTAIGAALSQTTHHPSTPAQYAALAALAQGTEASLEMQREFGIRRDFVLQKLTGLSRLHYMAPQGAFYVFCDISRYLGSRTRTGASITDSSALCEYLLENHGVVVIPGSAFGSEGYIRLSFGASMAVLESAMQRLRAGLEALV